MVDEIRNFKEFLLTYNRLTEACFDTCVYDFNRRTLAQKETDCVKGCAYKFMNLNRKIADVFAELGPSFMQHQSQQLSTTKNS